MEGRTERELDKKREEKWQTCWCYRDQQRACGMVQASAEELVYTGPAQMKRMATERAIGKYARAAFAKRERNKAVCPEHQIVRRAFSVREVKRTATEERKRDKYSSAKEQWESK